VAHFEEERQEMIAAIRVIAEHLAAEIGKTALDERVLSAMGKVPRHEFVPVELQPYAYLNRPLPIGFDKTISQPLIVAVMTDLLELKPDDVVLEIGTGLGYQSAILAELAGKVYTIEMIDSPILFRKRLPAPRVVNRSHANGRFLSRHRSIFHCVARGIDEERDLIGAVFFELRFDIAGMGLRKFTPSASMSSNARRNGMPYCASPSGFS
jgi:hypothetical protein